MAKSKKSSIQYLVTFANKSTSNMKKNADGYWRVNLPNGGNRGWKLVTSAKKALKDIGAKVERI